MNDVYVFFFNFFFFFVLSFRSTKKKKKEKKKGNKQKIKKTSFHRIRMVVNSRPKNVCYFAIFFLFIFSPLALSCKFAFGSRISVYWSLVEIKLPEGYYRPTQLLLFADVCDLYKNESQCLLLLTGFWFFLMVSF